MSGITVSPECGQEWTNMKVKHMYNYITFKVENEKEIIIDQKGQASYADFCQSCLSAKECRYAVVEVPGTTKIVFIMWAPDSASIKDKMIYASSRGAILDCLGGHSKAIQATDLSDIAETRIKASV